jgi:hypothetical protein
MIWITKTISGLLIQRDGTEIAIDSGAVALALPGVLNELIDCGRSVQNARRAGYEAGLVQGHINATIEYETSIRIAERQADDLVEALAGVQCASAA